jgi:hypothetical protein
MKEGEYERWARESRSLYILADDPSSLLDPTSMAGWSEATEDDSNNNGHGHPILLISKSRNRPRETTTTTKGENDETHDARGG